MPRVDGPEHDRTDAPAVRLRGHHLLCILTYVGRGYSPAFVAAMDAVVERIRTGAPVRIVDGPDDICAAHVAEAPDAHCHGDSAAERDRRAVHDVAGLMGLGGEGAIRLTADRLDAARELFRTGRSRSACRGCSWADLCTSIAADGFAGARLAPADAGEGA
nr:DUF1284 domain-containing protein [Chthonobacter rhizosphaerae]